MSASGSSGAGDDRPSDILRPSSTSSQPHSPSSGAAEAKEIPFGMAGPAASLSQEIPEATASIEYRLEVVQGPIRGRTCGFGDSDRRALSPPLIIRLRVFRSDGEEIEAEQVDMCFLICAADLWSADRSREMNLVQHPLFHFKPIGLPYQVPPRHSEELTSEQQPSSLQYGLPHNSGPFWRKRSSTSSSDVLPNHPVPCASASQDQQRLSLTSSGRERSKIESGPFVQSSPQAATSPFLYHHRHHEFRIGTSGGLPPTPSSPTTAIFAFHPPAFPDPASHHEAITHSRRESLHTSSSTLPPQTGISSGHRPYSSYTPRLSTSATSIMADPSVSVHEPARADAELACVRNLVGALTTNGHTLRAPGESRNGIWFVFHDLSVRTEGVFTLRLRLAAVGSPLTGLHTGASRVLFETFSPPFEVMSAKRFPGMIDPTPLSQAFAKQGVRIPTRKGANRKRRRLEPSNTVAQETKYSTVQDEEEDPGEESD
ncbi:MAG: hypothetical protein CYPHOPRED_004490 [Cyphobasidiales sp. Tagirdzhanova-0007]|nr:MAG: hypothetical protein CYPHOPRED_004490 [Cyphobasidiales sp. Tagirdzhanova-0007]